MFLMSPYSTSFVLQLAVRKANHAQDRARSEGGAVSPLVKSDAYFLYAQRGQPASSAACARGLNFMYENRPRIALGCMSEQEKSGSRIANEKYSSMLHVRIENLRCRQNVMKVVGAS